MLNLLGDYRDQCFVLKGRKNIMQLHGKGIEPEGNLNYTQCKLGLCYSIYATRQWGIDERSSAGDAKHLTGQPARTYLFSRRNVAQNTKAFAIIAP
jgi:hypothetical protein